MCIRDRYGIGSTHVRSRAIVLGGPSISSVVARSKRVIPFHLAVMKKVLQTIKKWLMEDLEQVCHMHSINPKGRLSPSFSHQNAYLAMRVCGCVQVWVCVCVWVGGVALGLIRCSEAMRYYNLWISSTCMSDSDVEYDLWDQWLYSCLLTGLARIFLCLYISSFTHPQTSGVPAEC